MTPFATETITVIRSAYSNERGNQVPDWGNATEHTVTNCSVQPLVGDEILGNRDAVVTRWKLFAPSGSDITSLDRIRHKGVVYEVDGDIQDWPAPIPGLIHIEAALQRVEG